MKWISGFLLLAISFSLQAQDNFLKQLEASPRHQEWVEIMSNGRKLRCFVVYPEVSTKATAVVVIHENRGLNDWARSMADQIAGAGFIAIAPDLLSGMAPNGGGTADFPNGDAARDAIYKLDSAQVRKDLNAVADYVTALPSSNRKVAAAGYCWGGGQCFRMATNNSRIKAAFVFYGVGPEDISAIRNVKAPVYGFYGGNDERVNATIPKSDSLMKAAGKKYEPVIYTGAGHGFMRAGQEPNPTPENVKARDEGFARLIAKLKEI
jgi:carboxymethylenebutenolidase